MSSLEKRKIADEIAEEPKKPRFEGKINFLFLSSKYCFFHRNLHTLGRRICNAKFCMGVCNVLTFVKAMHQTRMLFAFVIVTEV